MPVRRPIVLALALLTLAPAAFVAAVPVPDDGAPVNPLASHPEGSYLMENGDVAVPLRLDTPSWYTEEMHAKVVAAGENGLAYDVENDVPVRLATQFVFIRPGAWMWAPSWCTMNFVYGAPGSYKIGSAGHCNAVGSTVTLVVYPGVLASIGKTVASHDNGVGDDWSIVDVAPAWQGFVDPNAAVVQGPQGGAFTGFISLTRPQPVKHFGHGLAIGTGGTPRAGVAYSTSGSSWACVCEAIFGDSGSAVLLAGSATYPLGQGLGVLTHLVVGLGGPVAGTRLTAIPYTIANGDIDPRP